MVTWHVAPHCPTHFGIRTLANLAIISLSSTPSIHLTHLDRNILGDAALLNHIFKVGDRNLIVVCEVGYQGHLVLIISGLIRTDMQVTKCRIIGSSWTGRKEEVQVKRAKDPCTTRLTTLPAIYCNYSRKQLQYDPYS